MANSEDLVVVVSGASRGIGRGIALAFGWRDATVYVTGRSKTPGTQRSPGGTVLPGSIYEVAEQVTAAGGRGIPILVDMAKDEDIEALFAQVKREAGAHQCPRQQRRHLNEALGIKPFWEAPVDLATIIDVGLRCHHVATYYAAKLLIAGSRGLIANISFYGDSARSGLLRFKGGAGQLAHVYADEFRPYNVAAISLWPGYVATERMTSIADPGDENVKKIKSGNAFESPEYTGRVLSAIYDDPNFMALSGKTLISPEIAERYGVADVDGGKPKSLRSQYGGPHASFDLK